jgi:EamA-like transporter family.
MTFGAFSTLYWAEQFLSSGIAAVLSVTGPLMILILQSFVMHHTTSRTTVFGCLVGFFGVILLMLPSLTVSAGAMWMIGYFAILIGELAYSSGALYSKPAIQRYSHVSPIALNAVQMMYGGLMLLLLSAFTEHVRVESLLTANAIGSLLYLTVIGSMVGHSLFYWLVSKTNPVFPATWLYVSPLIALVIGLKLKINITETYHK